MSPFPIMSITTSYLMTIHVPLEAPKNVSSELVIYNCEPGGWVKGPGIDGVVVPPTADWLRIMNVGSIRMEPKAT